MTMTTTKHSNISISLCAPFFSFLVWDKHFKHPHVGTATAICCLRSTVYGIVCICLNLITICIFSEWVILCTHNFIILSTYTWHICAFCISRSSFVHSFASRWCDHTRSTQCDMALLVNRINGYCNVEQHKIYVTYPYWLNSGIWNCFTLL